MAETGSTDNAVTQAARPVIWTPSQQQALLIACPAFEVLFGGARGGGKTDGVLGDWIRHANDFGQHAIGLMVRRERTQLVETIERSRQIYAPLGATFQETEKMWRFPNGARLRFAYLERDSDADAYQGHSYTRLYMEELTTFPSSKPVMKLMATLRSGAGVPCGFRATANPGGPGHHWVKTRYIDPAPGGWKRIVDTFKNPWTGEKVERDRIYIPSRVTDNRYLGADYVANLQMAGSPQLVRAWLAGDWSVIEGAFFDSYATEKHVVRPFRIPPGWIRFRAMDWGSAAPFAVYWCAVATDDHELGDGRVLPRNGIVVYREWYGASSPNTGLKLTADEVARGIAQRDAGESFQYSVLDPAAFARDGGPSIAERMAEAVPTVQFRRADNKRVADRGAMGGWDQVRQRLNGEGDKRPMLIMFETCKDLIRTLPALQHDSARPEDLDTASEDHAADALRYACMSRPWAAQRPEKPKPIIGWEGLTLDQLWEEHEKEIRRDT